MRAKIFIATTALMLAAGAATSAPVTPQAAQEPNQDDPIRELVSRLTLENYKTTLKGLTQFGDRQQGTQRNRDAVDWIEAQLQSFGCTSTERITYMYPAEPRPTAGGNRGRGARGRGQRGPATEPDLTTPTGGIVGRNGSGPGGSSIYGYRARTGVNRDLEAQPDERIRALNVEEPVDGERQLVYCTKVGTTNPDEMYILGAHMDGHGVNEAVNDDGSGTALVMELARVFNAPGVETERSIRFALWNNEETGLNGARAYVAQRQDLQGIESPAGSGQYPEPRWLGMIQHDMMLWDHGAPRADGTVSRDQRPEADVNIEFQSNSDLADDSMKLAFVFKAAADAYNTDYPATVGPHMTNTDSTPFMNIVPSISMRENERGAHTGAGWNPTWHTPLDVWTTFTDKDFRLGLNAGQTTLSAVALLHGSFTGRVPLMARKNAGDFDKGLLDLFDNYVHGGISRREFMDGAAKFAVGGLTAAALVESLSPNYADAQQVSPDDPRLVSAQIDYPSPQGAGTMRGLLARPADIDTDLPGVVVIHENRGLNPYIEDVVRRTALAGFLAFGPDALAPLGGYPGTDDEGRELQRQRDRDEMTEDFVAAAEFLKARPECSGRIGAVGFCFGGGMANTLAVRIPDLGAAVPFYGGQPAAEDVPQINAPLLIHYAGLDTRVNAGWPAYEEALEANGARYTAHIYEGVNHGFHNDTTPRYDAEAAALAWDRTIEFFNQELR